MLLSAASWEFTHVWEANNPAVSAVVKGTIEACTQQFDKPFDYVPHGWKTIILCRFRDHIPLLVGALPKLDTWSYSPVLHIGSYGTWRSALASSDRGADAGAGQVEVAAALDRESLRHLLMKWGVDVTTYNLEGSHESEQYVLAHRSAGWVTFYAERGEERDSRQFDSEADACAYLLDWILRDRAT